MGNQATIQQRHQQSATEAPDVSPPLKQHKKKTKDTPEHQKAAKQSRSWLSGKHKKKQQPNATVGSQVEAIDEKAVTTKSETTAVQVANGNGTSNGKSHPASSNNNNNSTNTNRLELNTDIAVASVVAVDMTPTPDSANRTWSEAELPVTATVSASDVGCQRHQRDSGISQLSTEEFERVFDELARGGTSVRGSWVSPELIEPSERLVEEKLVPRLRVKPAQRSPTLVPRAVSYAVKTEELLLLRQELMSMSRHCLSTCLSVNDDHLFPNAVTPSKVDSGLLSDYDVPYMDDENFFVFDDWYITDDKRWSYLRRSDTPQLADWDDCRLTEPVANSAKATPHTTPTKFRRAIFGLCFGAKRSA